MRERTPATENDKPFITRTDDHSGTKSLDRRVGTRHDLKSITPGRETHACSGQHAGRADDQEMAATHRGTPTWFLHPSMAAGERTELTEQP